MIRARSQILMEGVWYVTRRPHSRVASNKKIPPAENLGLQQAVSTGFELIDRPVGCLSDQSSLVSEGAHQLNGRGAKQNDKQGRKQEHG